MPRTDFRSQNDFFIEGQGGVSFPSKTSPSAGRATITFPVGSKVRTGLHWHEQYTEYLAVVQGVALVTLDDKMECFGTQDGVIVIPRYTKHEYRRADTEAGRTGGDGRDFDLILQE